MAAAEPATVFTPRYMSDLYVEHVEEIEFLWAQRTDILRSPAIFWRDLVEHDQRIEAHVDALHVPGLTVVAMIEHYLDEDDADMVFAAAYPLLRLRDGALSERIVAMYEASEGNRRLGFEQAFTYGPISQVASKLERHYSPDNPLTALATLRIFAFHDPKTFRPDVISILARHEDRDMRGRAWQVARYGSGMSEATYQNGIRDPDPEVRFHAATAAAWGRQQFVLNELRNAVHSVTPESWNAACLLASLGDESDYPRLLPFAQNEQLGPDRFRVLGQLGRPDGINVILEGMASDDPATAEAAARAYTKITGVDVNSGERAEPDTSNANDDFDVEFAPEYVVPDTDRARSEWERLKPSFVEGTRWCRGHNVTQGIDKSLLEQVDLESRAELCLRSQFLGAILVSAIDLERLTLSRQHFTLDSYVSRR